MIDLFRNENDIYTVYNWNVQKYESTTKLEKLEDYNIQISIDHSSALRPFGLLLKFYI